LLTATNCHSKENHMSTITTRRHRFMTTAVAALSVTAMIPASAFAATSHFGSSLNHTPANAGSSCADDGVGPQPTNPSPSDPAPVPTELCTHVGSYYPGFSGHAASPNTGTITQLKIRPQGPMTFTAQVVTVRNFAANERSGQAKATANSRHITLAGPTQSQMDDSVYPVDTVNVHLKVAKGQKIAITTASNTAEYCSDGTPGQLLFDPTLTVGNPFAQNAGVDDCLMLVQALVTH
jgi:hypothetical protein